MKPSRRQFLGGVTAATALACLSDIRQECTAAVRDAAPGKSPDWTALRQQYLLADDVTYLNHASIGTIPRPVHNARMKYLELCESNPWLYMWGGKWEAPREDVRSAAANYLGAKPSDTAITHNTTEVFNVLAQGLPLEPADEVLWSSLAHAGSTQPFQLAQRRGRLRTRSFAIPLDEISEATPEKIVGWYAAQIRPATRVLVLPHVDNTVGLRHPIKELTAMARAKGVEFVAVNAAQTVAMLPINVAEWDADVVATSPHKWLQAPKGLGLAVIHQRLHDKLHPMWVTWGQTRWKGSARIFEDYGTRNHAEVLAMGHAVEFQQQITPTAREDRLRQLWQFARETCDDLGLRWRSPQTWESGASLYAVEVPGQSSADVFQRISANAGFIVRPFGGMLNTLRISPNIVNTTAEIGACLRAAKGV